MGMHGQSEIQALFVCRTYLLEEILGASAVEHDLAILAHLDIVFAVKLGETPFLGDNDLLSLKVQRLRQLFVVQQENWRKRLRARELVSATAKSLEHDRFVLVFAANGHENLANVDTGDLAVGFAESASHTGLQSIGAGTGQHLVDADDVEGVDANAHVERFLACVLDDVLVGANTGSFQSL